MNGIPNAKNLFCKFTFIYQFKKSNYPLIKKSVFASLIQTVGLSFILAYAFYYFGDYSYKDSLLNAIPLSIISSAIAIPSVKNITKSSKEFIIYESSLSDIFGVIFFDFIEKGIGQFLFAI